MTPSELKISQGEATGNWFEEGMLRAGPAKWPGSTLRGGDTLPFATSPGIFRFFFSVAAFLDGPGSSTSSIWSSVSPLSLLTFSVIHASSPPSPTTDQNRELNNVFQNSTVI